MSPSTLQIATLIAVVLGLVSFWTLIVAWILGIALLNWLMIRSLRPVKT